VTENASSKSSCGQALLLPEPGLDLTFASASRNPLVPRKFGFLPPTFGTRRRHGDPPLLIIVLCFDSGIFIATICIDADQKLALFSTIN
jgi:hypothetical protein